MAFNRRSKHDIAVQSAFRSLPQARQTAEKAKIVPEILLGEHSRYQVKSGWLAGTYVARAFPKPPTKARGLIAEATGATEEAAIEALEKLINAREDRRTEERRDDAETGTRIPSVEEYVEAVRQVTLSAPQRAMLKALYLAGEDGLTDARMTYAAGYKSESTARRSFVASGLLLAEYLNSETGAYDTPAAADGTAILGFRGESASEEDLGNWILHPELRDAVRLTL